MTAARASALQLARQIRNAEVRPDLVIGVANGGVYPAFYIAEELGVPLRIYRVFRTSARLKEQFAFLRKALRSRLLRPLIRWLTHFVDATMLSVAGGPDTLHDHVADKHVLVVDDCIDSGASMHLVRSKLIERGAAQVSIAVLCWTDRFDSVKRHGVAPDFVLVRRLDSYPWSADNPEFLRFKAWLQAIPQS
jgi:hypoxanthine phosphoribosyltransferase